MKRAVVVVLGLLSVLACTPFEPNGNGSNAGDASTDASDFCNDTIACDPFEGGYGSEWMGLQGDRYQAHVDHGMLVCSLPANTSDARDGTDGCRLERKLLANVKMRIELDLTFHPPNDDRGHNIQVFAIYNGLADTRAYLGLYVQNPSAGKASVVLTVAHTTGEPEIVGTGSITYNVKTHVALDVSFGSGSAVFFDSLGATPVRTQTFTSSNDAPVLRIGLSRLNGGTDALGAEYDNFRVTKVDAF